MKLTSPDKRRRLAWIASAVCLLALAISLRSRDRWADESSGKPAAAPAIAHAPAPEAPRVVREERPVSSRQPSADIAAAYASEEFTHVPDWIPRPPHAVTAAAENATLRSDGLREGTVRFTVASGFSATTEWLGQTLVQAGFRAEADGSFHASESPPRHCHVKTESVAPDLTHIILQYEASDHKEGCVCPTCNEAAPPSE